MTMASTTVEVADEVDIRVLLPSRRFSSGVFSFSGQPMAWAKFSMDGVCGLLLLASTRWRKLELRRARVLGVGEAGSARAMASWVAFCGEG